MEGAIRLVHIGTRSNAADASTLNMCIRGGGCIDVVDVSVEDPYTDMGIEVGTAPTHHSAQCSDIGSDVCQYRFINDELNVAS